MRRLLAAWLALLVVPAAAAARPGDLDPGFGRGGKVVEPRIESATALDVTGFGSIAVAGSIPGTQNLQTGVLRVTPHGSVDKDFGDRGLVIPRVRLGELGFDPAGRLVLAGAAGPGDAALERLLPDGAGDPSFGEDGVLPLEMPGGSFGFPTALAVAPDGRMFVAAAAQQGGESGVAILALDPSGNRDPSFGGDGVLFLGAGSPLGYIDALALRPDASLVAGGTTANGSIPGAGDDIVLLAIDADGEIDREFGDRGVTRIDYGQSERLTSLQLAPNGDAFAGGQSCRQSFDLVCGSFALRIGGDGRLAGTFDPLPRPVYYPGPSVLWGGGPDAYAIGTVRSGAPTTYDFAVMRLRADGSSPSGFGDNGVAVTDFGFGSESVGQALPANERIVVAGSTRRGGTAQLALARYLTGAGPADADADGSLDDDDRCPSRFGLRHRGCPLVARRFNFIYWDPPVVKGELETRLTSKAQGCSQRVAVRIRRNAPGPDPTIARTHTNVFGQWRIATPKHREGLYAYAPRRTLAGYGVCDRARSRTLENGP